MYMSPRSAGYIWDATRAPRHAIEVATETDEDVFIAEWRVQAIVERQLEIIGEALNNLLKYDNDTAKQILELRQIIGIRNVISHGYRDVDYRRIFSNCTRGPAAIGC